MKKAKSFKNSWITLGIGLALALMMGSASAQEEPEPAAPADCARTVPATLPSLPSCAGTVPRYSACEITLTSARTYSNPFTNVDVKATFTGGLIAYGFYDGGNTWRIRFAPKTAAATVVNYTISNTVVGNTPDANLDGSGSFTVGNSSNKGFIEDNGYYFKFTNGTKFYGFGDTAYGMVNGISDAQRKAYIENRSQKGFNFIRFYANGVPKAINANVVTTEGWPWGGQPGTLSSPGTPDYTRINPQFFKRLEHVLAELKACNMYAEMIVFYTSNRTLSAMTSTAWTTAHEALWERYVVSRLSAYDRIFLWTVANEYDTYPKGNYNPFTFTEVGQTLTDNTWAKNRAAKFHLYDPHKHPTTVHPWESPQTYGNPPGTPPALDIGPRFGSSAEIDVLSQQHWGEFAWSDSKGCLDELPGTALDHLDVAIRRDRSYVSANPKPVVNTESPYERLLGTSYPQAAGFFACPDKTRRSAWRIFLGGGATYANGFAPSFMGRDPYDYKEIRGASFSTDTTAGGMGNHLRHFVNFVNQTGYQNMNPAQSLVTPNTGFNSALCRAKPGSEYVVYAPNGGNVSLNLTGQTGTYTVTRLDPRTGVTTTLTAINGGAWRNLAAPTGNDYVFRVKLQ